MADDGWYSNDAATFGDRVAGAREALGISQSDLAKRIGVKPKTIIGWEEDITEPRAHRLNVLAGFLNVSLMWLLNGEGEGLASPQNAEDVPDDISALLDELHDLKVEMKSSADRMARIEKRLRLTLRTMAQ